MRIVFLLIVLSGLLGSSVAQAQMPDLSQMSGTPLPTSELPVGSVSVRVVRGSVSNNIPNQAVELRAGAQVWNATTDENGRATFSGIAPGTSIRAATTVDGTRLESQEFPVPASGGVRLMLVAKGTG